MTTTYQITPHQLDVLSALGKLGEANGNKIAKASGAPAGSVYGTLRVLQEHGFVEERQTRVGDTPKGNRYAYRPSRKGKAFLTRRGT